MNKVIWTTIKTVLIVLGALATAASADSAKANDGMSPITSVSELRDVSLTEWAYEALRSLVERYGCIVGYPDRSFRGNKALSRWEFAAGLNACLNVLKRLIQEGGLSKDDLDKLRRLAQEFRVELAALGARVDNLEARVSFLENHQFSTITTLRGEVIFSIANAFGSNSGNTILGSNRNPAGAKNSFGGQAAFTNRVHLNFLTSFTGRDQLRTRLQAGNGGGSNSFQAATGVPAARLAYDTGLDNSVELDDLFYRFPIDNFTVIIGANSLNLEKIFETYSPYLQSGGRGSVSRAQRYNSIVYRASSDGTGLAVEYKFSDNIALTGLYLAKSGSVANPTEGNGLFNGGFTTGYQLDVTINEDFRFGLTYVYTYDKSSPNLFTVGSPIGNNPFNGAAVTANRYGLQTSWYVFQGLNFSGWLGYAQAFGQGFINNNPELEVTNRKADILSWNAALSFIDLGKEGAVLSLSGGLLPTARGVDGIINSTGTAGNFTSNSIGSQDRNSSYMVQAQYAFPVTNNIQLTPGVYVIFNPNGFGANSEVWVGVLRTTFSF